MSEVVTTLTIDADTSGASQYSQAMAGAEQAASSGLKSANDFSLGLVALGTGAVAALAGLKGMLDYVVGANKDLADMQTLAQQVGLTLTDFQGIKLGGAISGLTDGQINSGLEKSASLLNDAQRNANSLSKELDANGISIKNSNGQLISENQLLGIAADLVQKANKPQDQIVIAQMLGFTKEWIPLLQQGSGAMAGLTEEAKKAGGVIDDETIQRASEFDAQWRKSSAEFSANMKASLLSLLPYVDDLIDGANKFVKSLDRKTVEDFADKQLKALAEPIGLPDEGALKISVTDEAKRAVEDIGNAATLWQGIAMTFSLLASRTPIANVNSIDPQSIPGYAASQLTEPNYPSTQQMDAAFDRSNPADPGSRKHPLPGLSASDYGSEKGTIIPGNGHDINDAYDRAINQIEKHTARTLADTESTAGDGSSLERIRAEARAKKCRPANDNSDAGRVAGAAA